jgi:hypothetical protein
MHEESKASSLQRQIDKVDKTLSQIPIIQFLTFTIGGLFLSLGVIFSYFFGCWIFMLGSIAFLTCMTVSTTIARNAKEEYRRLTE